MDERSTKVSVDAVSKRFSTRDGEFEAIRSTSLTVQNGEFLSIVGPSGCGKTTLLRMIARLDSPTTGAVRLHHERTDRPFSAVVFQEASIFPWMTTRQNAEYGLAMQKMPAKQRWAVVAPLLEQVGLDRFANVYPNQLSGGMKQRTSLARAFATDPEVLLMDEPFAAVDEQTRMELQNQLLDIWEGSRKTVIFITHSIQEALLLSDRVVVMRSNPGAIRSIVDVPFSRPRDIYQLKADPQFGKLEYQIWEELRTTPIKVGHDA